jgi:hypothetical protein
MIPYVGGEQHPEKKLIQEANNVNIICRGCKAGGRIFPPEEKE